MKKVNQEDMNTIWSGSGTLVELQSAYNRIVISINEMEQYIEELEEERDDYIKLAGEVSIAEGIANDKLKRIEEELYSSKPMTNRLANCKSILEEGVDQDENN